MNGSCMLHSFIQYIGKWENWDFTKAKKSVRCQLHLKNVKTFLI